MTSPENFRRAQDARRALSPLTIETDGLDTAIVDQLTNLMHLAKHHRLEFADLAAMAETHFNVETAE